MIPYSHYYWVGGPPKPYCLCGPAPLELLIDKDKRVVVIRVILGFRV